MTAPGWPELEELFHEALAHPAGERAAWLAERCADRPDLRAQVEAMLRAHDEASRLDISSIAVRSPLTAGARLGAYEIVGELGAGAMGEVYRARDKRLGREVAIKVLPAAFIADTGRVARFEREARLLASLNHPNIAAIYGIEEGPAAASAEAAAAGEAGRYVRALVMELVEGTTLAERLAQGTSQKAQVTKHKGVLGRVPPRTSEGVRGGPAGLPVDDALTIAKQIAEALEAAHEKGIIHRDLKPANIKITPAGTVKVLDFGLAKVMSRDAASSQAPTVTMGSTQEGLIVGTAAYMSPEQARGKDVDKRTDIWAFGCVLYEMLTGRAPFARDTITDTLAAVVERDPEWRKVPPATPPAIVRLLHRCLEKDRRRRLHDIADARIELEEFLTTQTTDDGPSLPDDGRRRLQEVAVGSVVVIAVLALAVFFWVVRTRPDTGLLRMTVLLPANAVMDIFPSNRMALSPDGRRLAFVAAGPDGRMLLWVRPLDALEPQPLPGTEGARAPFWSPDGRFIGFFATGKLKRIDATGGPPVTLCDAPGAYLGGTWNRDGVILFSFSGAPGGSIHRVSAAGGISSPVTARHPEGNAYQHMWPSFLPDGRRFLYLALGVDGPAGIYTGSLDSTEQRLVLRDASSPRYASGYLTFMRGTTLMAQPFDAERLEPSGDAAVVAENVQVGGPTRGGAVTVSETGVLAYQIGPREIESSLTWFDRGGTRHGVVGTPGNYFGLRFSPEGKRLAAVAGGLWIFDVTQGTSTLSNFESGNFPVWSPDGNRLVASCLATHFNICSKTADGGDEIQTLLKSDTLKVPTDWSPDGRFVVYQSDEPRTRADLYLLPLSGDRQPRPFLQTRFREAEGRLSPDGRWIAYSSDQSGTLEVYVRPFPSGGGEWQVSTQGGEAPRWRGDGKELVYVAPDLTLMAAAVEPTVAFRVNPPKAAFRLPTINRLTLNNTLDYEMTADGQRFLVNAPSNTANPITVVLNWTAALKN